MNLIGAQTLLKKEIRRFLRVPGQTVLQPLVSTSLYFVVFASTAGAHPSDIDGVPFMQYMVPGLVFLGIANNAFMNSSSSFFITKIQNTLVDLLVAPLGPVELLYGFILGAMVRGLFVGLLSWAVALAFIGVPSIHFVTTVIFLGLSAYVFAVLGLLAGMWAEKFEQVNFFPTFLMMPLTFLGGVFYSVKQLPEPFRSLSLANPVVYMVDGLRAGMLGTRELPLPGLTLLCALALTSTVVAWQWLRSGYKLRT